MMCPQVELDNVRVLEMEARRERAEEASCEARLSSEERHAEQTLERELLQIKAALELEKQTSSEKNASLAEMEKKLDDAERGKEIAITQLMSADENANATATSSAVERAEMIAKLARTESEIGHLRMKVEQLEGELNAEQETREKRKNELEIWQRRHHESLLASGKQADEAAAAARTAANDALVELKKKTDAEKEVSE